MGAMLMQEEVAGFQPSAADLDYPGKLERLAEAHDLAASGAADRGDSREEGEADEQAPLAGNDAQVCCMKPKRMLHVIARFGVLSQHNTLAVLNYRATCLTAPVLRRSSACPER